MYIIHQDKNAGVGHQLKNIWSIFILAELFKLKPIKCDLQGVHKTFGNFLNYNEGTYKEPKNLKKIDISYNSYEGLPIDLIEKLLIEFENQEIIINLVGNTRFMLHQVTPGIRNKVVTDFITKYNNARKSNPVISKFSYDNTVAIHIRRGEIHKESIRPAIAKRWVDEKYYVEVIKQIEYMFPNKYTYHIFSESNKFPNIKELGVPVKFRTSGISYPTICNFFDHMLHADIFVAAPSAFSYIVGELRSLPVIYLERVIQSKSGDINRITPFSSEVNAIEASETGKFNIDQLKELCG